MKLPHVAIKDEDGDLIEVGPVYGFGRPTLAVFITCEGELAGMNLTQEDVKRLLPNLTAFAETGKFFPEE